MITKTDFCKFYVRDFCEKNKIPEKKLIEEINYYITKSSCLGIALSYLYPEKLSQESIQYISTRGGIYITAPSGNVLSFREALSCLPFELDKEEEME